MNANEIKAEDYERILRQVPEVYELRNARVLITGCTGFIPGELTEFFVYLNSVHNFKIEVTGLCRSRERASARFGEAIKIECPPEISQYHFQKEFDVVFHAASPANRLSFSNVYDLIQTNVVTTQRIIDSKCASRLVYFSSGEVYGGGYSEPVAESTPLVIDPESRSVSYALFKLAGEHLCALSFNSEKFVRIARIFHTYGYGITLYDGRIQSDLIGDAVHGKALILKSDGEAIRSFCYISDTIAALLSLALRDSRHLIFNVGNAQQIFKIKDFARTLADVSGVPLSIGTSTDTSRFVGRFSAPNTNRLESLGWRPEVELHNGLVRTLRGFNVTV